MPINRWYLLIAAVVIAVVPFFLPGLDGDFKGTDDRAIEMIVAAHPDYQPWFQPLWTPPSNQLASLLFAIQAALGAGVVGYVIGRRSSSSNNVTRR